MKKIERRRFTCYSIKVGDCVYSLGMGDADKSLDLLAFSRIVDSYGNFTHRFVLELNQKLEIKSMICDKSNYDKQIQIEGVLPELIDNEAIYKFNSLYVDKGDFLFVKDKCRNAREYSPYVYPFEFLSVLFLSIEDGHIVKKIDLSEEMNVLTKGISMLPKATLIEDEYEYITGGFKNSQLIREICPMEDYVTYFDNFRRDKDGRSY